jgi:hypothetical protein
MRGTFPAYRFGQFAILMALLGIALLCPACGQSSSKPVYPVRGQVLFEGRPTPQAFVVFHPLNAAEENVPRPQGYVNKDGSFTLSTYSAGDGAPAGEYAVTVEWRVVTATRKAQEGDTLPSVNRLPSRYASARTSGLRAQVAAGPNEPTLRLTR